MFTYTTPTQQIVMKLSSNQIDDLIRFQWPAVKGQKAYLLVKANMNANITGKTHVVFW